MIEELEHDPFDFDYDGEVPQELDILPAYSCYFHSPKKYFIVSGGRGSGKSFQTALYFLIKLFEPTFFQGVIARYTQKSIKHSIYSDIEQLALKLNVKHLLSFRGEEIVNLANNNKIITHSFRLPDSSQVAKGKGLSNVTHLLIDEAMEVPDEQEFIKLVDTFRTKGVHIQIFVLFNPGTKRHWIFKRWFLADGSPNPKWNSNHRFIHTTYKDNLMNLNEETVEEWDALALTDPEQYAIMQLGMWSEGVKGKVYKGWQIGTCDDPEAEPLYGMDFGWNPDPSVCVEVKRKGKTIWVKEMVYGTELLAGDDMFDAMVKAEVPFDANIFGDSSNKGTIEDLRRKGFRAIDKCRKGNDSVRLGIMKIKGYTVYVDPNSKHIWDEYQLYAWDERTGKPIDKDNHCMDAIRYAMSHDKIGPTPVYGENSHRRNNSISQDELDMYT